MLAASSSIAATARRPICYDRRFKPVRVFCSYSHKDKRYLNKLRTSLDVLSNQGLIEEWHDRKIVPGDEWDEDIDKHLETADIILLLVSPDFLSSEYIRKKELEQAMRK